jgi:23S rRNA pseudouridine2605 synthase
VKSAAPLRKVGLARALSKLGYCSRSRAADLIRAGRVRLNGAARRDPETPVHLEKDCIAVDGAAVSERRKVYLVLNKPRGVVTTASDEKRRKTVYDCLGEKFSWIAPVGRLDKASEGLLLFTNDSEWAARVHAPQTHLDKTYHVQLAAIVDESFTRKMEKGVQTGDGDFLQVRKARALRQGERNTWLEVDLDEGKNRHIHRMLDRLGVEVLRLLRVAVGPVALGQLAKGSSRPLTRQEELALDQAMKSQRTPPEGKVKVASYDGETRAGKSTWPKKPRNAFS